MTQESGQNRSVLNRTRELLSVYMDHLRVDPWSPAEALARRVSEGTPRLQDLPGPIGRGAQRLARIIRGTN